MWEGRKVRQGQPGDTGVVPSQGLPRNIFPINKLPDHGGQVIGAKREAGQ